MTKFVFNSDQYKRYFYLLNVIDTVLYVCFFVCVFIEQKTIAEIKEKNQQDKNLALETSFVVEIFAIIGMVLCVVGFFIYEHKKAFSVYKFAKFAFQLLLLLLIIFHWKNLSTFQNDVLDSVGLQKTFMLDIFSVFFCNLNDFNSSKINSLRILVVLLLLNFVIAIALLYTALQYLFITFIKEENIQEVEINLDDTQSSQQIQNIEMEI